MNTEQAKYVVRQLEKGSYANQLKHMTKTECEFILRLENDGELELSENLQTALAAEKELHSK